MKEKRVNISVQLLKMMIYLLFIIGLLYLVPIYIGSVGEVVGNSMNNTLSNGDKVWINILSYHLHDPQRFDVIVIEKTDEDDLIKRVIGLPGEKIYIDENGKIFINGNELQEEYGAEIIDCDNRGLAAEEITLDKDSYFVLGDNRNHSTDSRSELVGNIKRSQISGKVRFRMSPFKCMGVIR